MNSFRIRFWVFFLCFYYGQHIVVRVSYFVFSVFPLCYCLVVDTSAVDRLERLEWDINPYTLTHPQIECNC